MRMFFSALLLGVAVGFGSGCGSQSEPAPASATTATNAAKAASAPTVYDVKGTLVKILPDGKTAKIKHEEIPGYMRAMTMDFTVKDPAQLAGLQPGDPLAFKMYVTEDDGWIDAVTKVSTAPAVPVVADPPPVRIAREVEPLKLGDAVPDYRFTNQLGQAVELGALKGQAVAITFIFTTCPFPTYCPRMSLQFQEAQQKLKDRLDAPKNWQLFSLSFDPGKDTPEVLKAYAERYNYDPARWNFLTGDLADVTAFTEQCGLQFWRENGTINHNLRTVVIDSAGRLHKVLVGNEWKSDELVEEIILASRAK